MLIYYQNLFHAQKLQERAHDKGVKSCKYASNGKVWLNGKHIKIKWNLKLKNKFLVRAVFFIQ